MSKTDPINIANPPGGSPPALGDDYIRTLARAVAEVLAVDHYMSINGNAYDDDDNGKHSKVTFREVLSSKPTLAANDKGVSYIKGVTPELHFEDAAGNEIQLTRGGRLYLGSVAIAAGSAVIRNNTSNASDNGRIDLAGGGDAATGRGGYVRVNGNQHATNPGQVELKPGFSDAGETIRAVISADSARIANLATPISDQDAATKKYVDDSIPSFGNWETKASGTQYTAETDGFVIAFTHGPGVEHSLTGKTPATTTRIKQATGAVYATSPVLSFTMPVKKGDTWRVDVSGSGATATVFWIPLT